MNKHQKLNKLTTEAPEEIPSYLKAAKLLKDINGLSISGDDQTLGKIKEVLRFDPKTNEGKELKKSILKEATKKASQGMFGDGIFFIS